MTRTIGVLCQDERLRIDPGKVEDCLHALDRCSRFQVPDGSLEVAFVDLPTCCQLHGDFFGDPDPTDVMTFPGDPEDEHAGDIAICPAVAAEACTETGLPFAEELTLYLVHAWLHLAGLEDHDPEAIARMREGESALMAHLRQEAALLHASWQA